ncbi:kinase-associated lipoprotein B [Aquibacillus sediminis]|uniref:kinase-associated lipoprotein B n=1 Tax=Aquibacillus sediminis TaxID=2574734 RepID=UPI001107F681|nr:kinase-associated lipoprotein B [Aquibacillus sediminis]
MNIDDIVKAHYKSGTYIGKLVEDRGEKYLVQVLAVIKHPLQGDIHNYGQLDGVFFHQRKALSYLEKMNVNKSAVHPYGEEVPDYQTSLRQAVEALKDKLTKKDTEFNQAALENLNQLEMMYFSK